MMYINCFNGVIPCLLFWDKTHLVFGKQSVDNCRLANVLANIFRSILSRKKLGKKRNWAIVTRLGSFPDFGITEILYVLLKDYACYCLVLTEN